MRELLFRGKSVYEGQWCYGNCILCKGAEIKLIDTRKDPSNFLWKLVDQNTVGQWTGLVDSKGKKIFEGDIVEYEDDFQYPESCENGIFMNRGVVEYSGHKFHFTNRNNVSMEDIIYEDEKGNMCEDGCYIIGNIHDNPELLEENI